jgi:hypothetical protein
VHPTPREIDRDGSADPFPAGDQGDSIVEMHGRKKNCRLMIEDC